MHDINAYLANTTQADIAASIEQQPFLNAKDLPLVTNQGIYRAKVIDAFLNEYNNRPKISINAFAELEGSPEHKGLLKLYIDVFYQHQDGNLEIARNFLNILSSCKCFDEQGRPYAKQVEKQSLSGNTFTIIENLIDKSFYVAIASRQFNGKDYLNPLAFFDENKRSPLEAMHNNPPSYIAKFSYLVSEGKPLKRQESRAISGGNNGFSLPPRPSIAPANNQVFQPMAQSAVPAFQAPAMQQQGTPWQAAQQIPPNPYLAQEPGVNEIPF